MYQPGDELRYVDWKMLGRSDRLYVKQYEEETNLRAMIVCDASRSMAWSGAPDVVLPKLDYAQRLIASLSLDPAPPARRDRADRLRRRGAAASRRPGRVAPTGASCSPRCAATRPGQGTAAAPALKRVVDSLRRRGLVVFVSDLLLDRELALTALRFLRHRGHQVVVLHLMDPAEVTLSGPAEARFEDPETGAAVVLRPRDWAEAYDKTVRGRGVRLECGVPAQRHQLPSHRDRHAVRPRAAGRAGELAGMTFLHPWLLAGLLAAGVPLLLHLVQRREPPTVVFPGRALSPRCHARAPAPAPHPALAAAAPAHAAHRRAGAGGGRTDGASLRCHGARARARSCSCSTTA